MKKVKFVILMLACLAYNGVNGQGNQQILDKVIAKIGGEVVLYSEVAEKMSLMKEQRGSVPENADCLILQSLMGSSLLVNQARLDSVLITDAEIEQQMNARMEQILSLMGNDLSLFQEVYGQSVTEMKAQVRDDMEKKILAERMQGQIMADVSVTPSEVIKFYNDIPKDSIPYFDSEVELGEIVYLPKINNTERKKALDRIAEIQGKLAAGEDFADLASTYSDDYGSAKEGGALGWNSRGTFVPEFEAIAYKLEKGETSEAVESQFGFHIIQLLDRRGNSINSRHILVKPKITDRDLALAANYLDSIKTLVEVDSMTFTQAVKKFSNDKVQSYSNNGRMINPQTGNTFFETREVDSDIFFAIDTIGVMDISAPIQYRSQSGEPMFRIVQLQSRSDPHKANLQQDYSKIQDAAKESKKNAAFNDWIEEKIESTYVEIDPHFKNCADMERWMGGKLGKS